MTETPEQIAERLLPCNASYYGCYTHNGVWNHQGGCKGKIRPAVAAALQSERDSRDSLQVEVGRLRGIVREVWRLSLVIESAVRNSDPINSENVNALIKSATAALTAGEKS